MKLNGIAITAVNHKTGVIKTAHDTNEPSNYVTQQLIKYAKKAPKWNLFVRSLYDN